MAAESGTGLFGTLPEQMSAVRPKGAPRLRQAERRQVSLRPIGLEDLLPPDHRARFVWSFAERLNLSALYGAIEAVEGHPGHPPADPRSLLVQAREAPTPGVRVAAARRTGAARRGRRHDPLLLRREVLLRVPLPVRAARAVRPQRAAFSETRHCWGGGSGCPAPEPDRRSTPRPRRRLGTGTRSNRARPTHRRSRSGRRLAGHAPSSRRRPSPRTGGRPPAG